MNPKTRNGIGWVLAGILAAVFMISAGMKFSGGAESEKMAEQMGITLSTLHLIGAVELISLLLFLGKSCYTIK